MGGTVHLYDVGTDDTLSREVFERADLVVLNWESDQFAGKICGLLGMLEEDGHPAPLLVTGPKEPPPPYLLGLSSVRYVPPPLDGSYLHGVLDYLAFTRNRIMQMDEEQTRVQALYEISSALLKVTERNQIAAALDSTLPGLFDASLMLLVLPADPTPVLYIRRSKDLAPGVFDVLRLHLKEAWDVLRPGTKASWDWVDNLSGGAPSGARGISMSSFLTTPLTCGSRTDGFLTILPRTANKGEETLLQSFFVVGDLLSVLLYNIDLREKLEERASTDSLTGLKNRQVLFECLERECRRSQRHHHPLAIVMIDLDNFKLVNDRYGHQAGDEALRHVASILKKSVRDTDMVGRCGGEEFIVVLPDTDAAGAEAWAQRLCSELQTNVLQYGAQSVIVTASLGVASSRGLGTEADRLVSHADAALYRAKAEGRNRVVLARPEDTFPSGSPASAESPSRP